ncbi:MAG: hypothetical protein HUU16_08695, partial [Candidatus Omnitrophica bacterium]|nr:hypothetical protein [Candidatus Omnitrophota bacterium]
MPARRQVPLVLALLVMLFGWAGPSPAQTAPEAGTPAQSAEAFGEEVTLAEKTIVFLKGHATWDNAFETLVDA